jgi:hypothetical protein
MSLQTINAGGTDFRITRTFPAPGGILCGFWRWPGHFELGLCAVPGYAGRANEEEAR